nr:ribonuclease H-like domain-containing protein [Tanacetum cinerariifolium]
MSRPVNSLSINGTTASSSSNTQNVAFVSVDNTSSTNDINNDNLEEIDLKWQLAIISMRIKKFYKRTGKKLQLILGIQLDDSKALVTIYGEAVDWSGHVEEDTQNFAMMAYSSSNLGSDNENGNGLVSVTTDTNGMIKVLPPKTAEEVVAKERERKARTTLLMALPEDHLAKFHKMADAKEMCEAIKSRFGGNDESKKMQKYLLKQQFEEIHGAGVSHEDANQKFLRSLPSSWSQVALIMRTKPGLDTLSFDDLYNNLRVFKRDVKGTTTSSSNTQNVAFVSADKTSSINDVSTAYSVSSPFVSKSQKDRSSTYTDEVIHSFFANQSSAPQLDYDDLEQINDDDMEEMDLKWQTKVECFNFHKIRHFAGDCRAKGNQNSRRRDDGYNGNKTRDNGRRSAYQDDSKGLVTIDGEDID